MDKKIYLNRSLVDVTVGIVLVATLFLTDSDAIAMSRADSKPRHDGPLLLAASIEDEKRLQVEFTDETQQKKGGSGWAFYFDNDLFASTGRDRDYTGGVSFTLSGPQAATYTLSVDPVLGAVNGWLGVGNSGDKILNSFEFGLTAFTPENIDLAVPLFDDRPYAGLIYISNTRQNVNYKNRSSVISSLTIGVLGLNIPGEFQNKLHKIFDATQAQGWGNQISDGGELTFRYSLSKQYVRWADYSAPGYNYEIKTARNVNVGYLTDLTWSVSGRFGKIRTPWSSFNPQNAAYAEKGLPLADLNNQPKNEFYFWAGLSVHLRAYNALIQGQFRDSAVTYDRDELNHVVGELWVGVTSELDSGLRLSYFLRGQSSEIKSGPGSRKPVWGGIIVSRSI